jgi:prefoldin subunit 5
MDNNDKNVLEQAEDMAGMELTATIEDGAFVIRPAEAGVALMASIGAHNSQLEDAWESADYLAKRLEDLRDENGVLRDELEDLFDYLTEIGNEPRASRITEVLWPVVGVLDDGTEVGFEYNDETNED